MELDHAVDPFESARLTFVERCAAIAAPAAVAAGLGAFVGPELSATAGAVGAVAGIVFAGLTERYGARVRRASTEFEYDVRERARGELQSHLEKLVDGAARTGAEYERRATFADDARRAQNQMLAELAPEFYGLLRSIGHHAEQLQAAELDSDERESANALSASAGSLRRLLGAVLDLARARAGRLRLRERDFDLLAALERISVSFEKAARRKGIEFQLSVGRLGQHWRFGDERRVQQMLERVLGAALDTTERGAIELVVHEVQGDAGRLCFELRDAAPIHDQASFERLLTDSPSGFESLFELDASLSLALARGLAEVLGGELTAGAQKEGGHRITVVVPLAAGTDPGAGEAERSSEGVGLRAVVAAPAGPLADLVTSTAAGLGWLVEHCTDRSSAEHALGEGAGADVFVIVSTFDVGTGVERSAIWTREWPRAAALLVLDPKTVVDPRALAQSGAKSILVGSPHPTLLRESLVALVRPTVASAAPTRALLASADDAVAEAETARLHARGLVVDRVLDAEELVHAFQDAVYGLVVVDQGSIDAPVKALAARLRAIDRMSPGPFKFHVLMGGNGPRSSANSTNSDPSVQETPAARTVEPSSQIHVTAHQTDQPIDPTVIAELRLLEGDEEIGLVAELIQMFLEDAPNKLDSISAAIERSDLAEAERIAHTLKSSSGNLGAVYFASTCREIESSCRSGLLDEIRSLVARSRSEFERVRDALAAELD